MKTNIIASVLALVLSTGFASAQSTSTPKAPEGCQMVEVSRPNTGTATEIYVTFQGPGATVEAIEFCNKGATGSNFFGITKSSREGAVVSIRVKDGVGLIALPTTYTEGRAHQHACNLNPDKKDFTTGFYEFPWSGGLKAKVALAKVERYPLEQLRNDCIAKMPPQIKKLLDLKA